MFNSADALPANSLSIIINETPLVIMESFTFLTATR